MITSFILLDGAAAPQGGGLSTIIMIVLIIAIFYFMMIRPQQKRQKEIKNFRSGLQKGDRVVTAGGIFGKVREIRETNAVVEIADNVKITVDLNSIYPANASAEQIKEQQENIKK